MAYSASWLNFASLAQKGAFKSLDELWPTYAPKNFAAQTEEAKQQALSLIHILRVRRPRSIQANMLPMKALPSPTQVVATPKFQPNCPA